MKTIALEKGSPSLDEALEAAESESVVYLTRDGKAHFALIALDEGDREILAQRNNEKLMQYLSECEQRARTLPRKSLKGLRAELGIETKAS
jgi:hypothetical protein